MGKLNQNFVMFKGDDLPLEFLHVGPFWASQSQVIELEAGDTAEWRLHAKDTPGTVHISKTSGANEIEYYSSGYYGGGNDTIRVLLEAADTSGLPAGEYGHQLIINYGGTDSVVVASGEVKLKERAS